jgi:hypothetical protein
LSNSTLFTRHENFHPTFGHLLNILDTLVLRRIVDAQRSPFTKLPEALKRKSERSRQ